MPTWTGAGRIRPRVPICRAPRGQAKAGSHQDRQGWGSSILLPLQSVLCGFASSAKANSGCGAHGEGFGGTSSVVKLQQRKARAPISGAGSMFSAISLVLSWVAAVPHPSQCPSCHLLLTVQGAVPGPRLIPSTDALSCV